MNDEQHVENVNNCQSPNRWKGDMQQAQSTPVETVTVNNQKIEIRRYEIGNKIEFRFPWRDNQGKRHFRCCRTIDEAKQAAQNFLSDPCEVEAPPAPLTAKLQNITPELLAAAAQLLGFQASTTHTFNQTLSEVCDEFMTAKKACLDRDEIRPVTYRELRSRVPDVKELMGKLRMDALNVELMDECFFAYKLAPRSVSNCRDALRAVLRWAVNRNKAPDSVLKDFNNMLVTGSRKKDTEKIDPFNREELTAVLNEALANKNDPTKTNYRMAAVIALQAFAGLRAAEACKLPWLQIELSNGVIRITPGIAKTKQARTIDILPCLRRWLELVPLQIRQGPVYSDCAYSKAQGRLARRVGRKMKGFHWRDNALRQAFIANYIAYSDSISQTAYLAGTSESKIRSNYWKLVNKADAAAYFGIVPPA
jgi:integrase